MNKKLEAIDNANPSEALGELKLVEDWIRDRKLKISNVIEPNLTIIKQALLELQSIKEAEPSEALKSLEILFSNVLSTTYNRESSLKDFNTIKRYILKEQEPKQYLKWKDLDFSYRTKVLNVRMNDTIYKIAYRFFDNADEVQLLSEDEKSVYFVFVGKYKDNIKLFNDLHLEVIE